MDNARARTYAGHMVCAATFKQARIPIQAAPATNNTRFSQANVCARPAAKVMAAKIMIEAPTTPSTDNFPQPRQAPRSQQRAQPKASEQQAVSARPVRTRHNRQQRQHCDRRQAERSRSHQHHFASPLSPHRTSRRQSPTSTRLSSADFTGRLHRYRNKITPKNEAAFSKNACRIRRPPSQAAECRTNRPRHVVAH